jgi:hypothetical protein
LFAYILKSNLGAASMLTTTEEAARDRRMAAIHEAGHMVAARRRRVEAYAIIWPNDTGDPFIKTWLGRAAFGRGVDRASDGTHRFIGVAGAVAEFCWLEARNGDEADIDCVWTWEDPEVMSPSDWRFARAEPGEPDPRFMRAVERVYAEFNPRDGALWQEVCRVARGLIVESRKRSDEPETL